MDIVLKNVKKKDFPILKSLAKSLGFEIEKEGKQYNPAFVKESLMNIKVKTKSFSKQHHY
jgi:hypothetical protein